MSLQHAASSPSAAYAVGRLDEHLAQIFKRGVGDVLDGVSRTDGSGRAAVHRPHSR